MPQDKRKNLEKAIEQAKSLVDKFNGNEEQALDEVGMPKDFINKVKSQIKSPLGQAITSTLGIEEDKAEEMLSSLTSQCPQLPSPAPYKPVTAEQRNEMMNKLRKGLKKF